MTIKEQLFTLMERIAAAGKNDKITVFICCEANTNKFCSMVGYRNEHGTGTVMHIIATAAAIEKLMNEVWNVANNINDGNGNTQ